MIGGDLIGAAFSEEQSDLRSALASFLRSNISLAQVSQWDQEKFYPAELFTELASLGYMGACISERYGGGGGGACEMAIITEELSRYGLDLGSGFSITAFLAHNIEVFGTEEQRSRYLPPIAEGEERHSISITEPDAGSDAGAIITKAREEAGGFVLTGNKVFTTGAGLRNTILHVSAVTESAPRNKIGVFLVPASASGVRLRKLDTVARHILGTYEVEFDEVRISEDQLLGKSDQGWEILMSGLLLERLVSASASIGAAQSVLEEAISYANERRQFGQTIGSFQSIAHRIADMWTDVLAARLATYNAAVLIANGRKAVAEVSAAKLLASETFQRVADAAMQILGGYGYMLEFHIQRFWREARSMTITAGTSEIQRSIIAKELGLFESLRKNRAKS